MKSTVYPLVVIYIYIIYLFIYIFIIGEKIYVYNIVIVFKGLMRHTKDNDIGERKYNNNSSGNKKVNERAAKLYQNVSYQDNRQFEECFCHAKLSAICKQI